MVVAAIVGAWYKLRQNALSGVVGGPAGNESEEDPITRSLDWLTIATGETHRIASDASVYHDGVRWQTDGELVLEEDARLSLTELNNE